MLIASDVMIDPPLVDWPGHLTKHGQTETSRRDSQHQAADAAQGEGKMPVGAGVILGPQGEAFVPVAIEAAAVAVEGAGRVHQAGEGPFSGLLIIGRHVEVKIFDAGVLVERALKGVEGPDESQAAADTMATPSRWWKA